MQAGSLEQVALLLRERNRIDAEIAAITNRPMTSGHLGEWLAAQVFGIDLEPTAVAAGIDGRFRSGPLAGRTVNVKWYLKREGILDVSEAPQLDYYLVLAGPASAARSSKGAVRPWCIAAAYLFDARKVLAELRKRGLKVGVASSVGVAQWGAAEIFPQPTNTALVLNVDQRRVLGLFAPTSTVQLECFGNSGQDIG